MKIEQPNARQNSGAPPAADLPDERELVREIKRGGEAALAAFYDRFAPRLFSLLAAIVHDEDEAQEVLQDSLLQMWRGTATFNAERSSLFTWAVMIARHNGLRRLRGGQRRGSAEMDTREPLALAFFRGLSPESIGETTGLSGRQVREKIVEQLRVQTGSDLNAIDSQQAALYALGILPAGEQAPFEQRLENDAGIRALLDHCDAGVAELARRVPSRPLPPTLRARVLAQAQRHRTREFFGRRTWLGWVLSLLFALSCGYLLAERGRLRHRIRHLEQRDPLRQVEIFSLGGVDSGPAPQAFIAWNPRSQWGILQVSGLSPNDPGQDYQLWLTDSRAQTLDAGCFHLTQTEPVRLSFRVQPLTRKVERFEIRLAPKGGASRPTGAVMMVSGR